MNFYKILPTFLVLFLAVATGTVRANKCADDILLIKSASAFGRYNRNANDDIMAEYHQYSGKSLNDIGDYQRCKGKQGAEFLFLFISKNKKTEKFSLGICLPQECKELPKRELINVIDFLGLVKPHNILAGFTIDEVRIPSEHNSKHAELKPTNYTIAAFCLFLGILSLNVLGTITDILLKRRYTSSILKKCSNFLLCFSVTKNFRGLLHKIRPEVKNDTDFLYGIRFFAFAYIFLHHFANRFTKNTHYLQIQLDLPPSSGFSDYLIGVVNRDFVLVVTEIIFGLTGFAITHGLIQAFKPTFKSITKFVTRRYIKLVVPQILYLIFFYFLMKYLAIGPLFFDSFIPEKNQCSYSSKLLYKLLMVVGVSIDEKNKFCLEHTWAFPIEFQVSIFILLGVIAYKKNRYLGWAAAFFFLATPTLFHYYIFGTYNISFLPNAIKSMLVISGRTGPFIMGMMLALLNHEKQNPRYTKVHYFFKELKENPFWAYVMFFAGVLIMSRALTLKEFYSNANRSGMGYIMFETYSRLMYFGAFSVMLIPMFAGSISPVVTVLNLRWLRIGGKISFSVFLIHFGVIFLYISNTKTATYRSNDGKIEEFVKCAILGYFMSFIFYLTVEKPVMNLHSKLFGRVKTYVKKLSENPQTDGSVAFNKAEKYYDTPIESSNVKDFEDNSQSESSKDPYKTKVE